jgi:benzoate/toluate 1,2-dioxygenase beta subunit
VSNLAEQRSGLPGDEKRSCEAGSEGGVRAVLHDVEQFIYREARLADEHRYDEWEALWTDDAVYWVPFGSDDADPETQMSVIYDNRSRIATRIKQFKTGKRHSATPLPRVRRIVSNIEVDEGDGAEILMVAKHVYLINNDRPLDTLSFLI